MIKSISGYMVRRISRRISVNRSRKAMLRFCIVGMYCSRYILIYIIEDLGLTGFGNLDRPYLILLSGHPLTAAAVLSCRSRGKWVTAGDQHKPKLDPFDATCPKQSQLYDIFYPNRRSVMSMRQSIPSHIQH
jgi:hypothetical protein